MHTGFGSTGGIVSPLNADGTDRVVFLRTDFGSFVIASKFKLGGNSSISSLLLSKLGGCFKWQGVSAIFHTFCSFRFEFLNCEFLNLII